MDEWEILLAFGDQAFVGKMTKEEDSDLVNDHSVPSVRLLDWYSEEKLMTPLTENEYANSMALGKDAKGYASAMRMLCFHVYMIRVPAFGFCLPSHGG